MAEPIESLSPDLTDWIGRREFHRCTTIHELEAVGWHVQQTDALVPGLLQLEVLRRAPRTALERAGETSLDNLVLLCSRSSSVGS